MDDKPKIMEIERMPKGGFIVRQPGIEYKQVSNLLFACTDIDDALGFVKDELAPEETQVSAEPKTCNCGQFAQCNASCLKEVNWDALREKVCEHCGIPDGEIRDSRCTAACGQTNMQWSAAEVALIKSRRVAGPVITKHGDVFK